MPVEHLSVLPAILGAEEAAPMLTTPTMMAPPPTTMATMTTLAAATMATMTTLAAATMTMTIPGPGHIHPVTDAAALQ